MSLSITTRWDDRHKLDLETGGLMAELNDDSAEQVVGVPTIDPDSPLPPSSETERGWGIATSARHTIPGSMRRA